MQKERRKGKRMSDNVINGPEIIEAPQKKTRKACAKKATVEKKSTVTKTRKRVNEKFSITLEDGSLINLDSYDWGEIKSQKIKLFVFWYTYPGSNAYKNGAKAAKKAGYSEKTAFTIAYQLKNTESVAKMIKVFDDRYVKTNIEDAYHKIIKRKIVRTEFNATEFYKFDKTTTEDGVKVAHVEIKTPDELTEEQKLCINGIDFAGQRSIPNYKLPNRKAEEDSIIEIFNKQNRIDNKDEFDVETTVEIIKNNLRIKTKIIKDNSEITKLSDLKNKSVERTEED